ncbi:MAG: hypothetical protein FRX49_06136 [Trebouxia sp. A1-2]|nr:MAG: hypothetical protein FRX49_06136 [Trebouxia sp. A1-2]
MALIPEHRTSGGGRRWRDGRGGGGEGSIYLRSENRQWYKATKEARGHPVSSKLADTKVANDEVHLAEEWQAAGPDVYCCLAPQLYRPACPPVLLLAGACLIASSIGAPQDFYIKAVLKPFHEFVIYQLSGDPVCAVIQHLQSRSEQSIAPV